LHWAVNNIMKRIDIWSKGEVADYILQLERFGSVQRCEKLRLQKGHLDAFYPKCLDELASRVPADNVRTDRTGFKGPSRYFWPRCPTSCSGFAPINDFLVSLTSDKRGATTPVTTTFEELHPKILLAAKSRFETGHYADSVEAALKEINLAVKERVHSETGKEYDGADLMRRAFSPNNPVIVLADLSTQSGKAEQQGYMEIFAGAMTGVRNPKAHANLKIGRSRALHLLFLASLLMWKLDDPEGST
jgi:uncharacterized protein (TIGR02391 family)